MIPSLLNIDPLLTAWLQEDIGRGDRTTEGLELKKTGSGYWIAKSEGVVAGLPVAQRVFQLLSSDISFDPTVEDGEWVKIGQVIAKLNGPLSTLLTV